MAKTEKIFRDPLYNYVTIDRGKDEWILDLLACREVQRLRRIRQLGVSHFTYPGADHSRFSHTLGVLHLMQQAWRRIESLETKGPGIERARHCLLAAAVLHDVGHGPFSHLFERPLGTKHDDWSCRIIRSPESEVHQRLIDPKIDIPPEHVAALIESDNRERPVWQKTLLSSELDVDRLDYLRRDSYFTGAGYGHFDWYRILNSFDLQETDEGFHILVWPEKAKYAIEEYVFTRFYMYNNVYQHKTTRGFEKMLHAAWDRAKEIKQNGDDAYLVREVGEFLDANPPTVGHYLALEDATVVYQVQVWTKHPDKTLRDLGSRFLARDHFVPVEDPVDDQGFGERRKAWEKDLREVVGKHGYAPPEYYALRDDLKLTVYDPYVPEKEEKEQDPYNAIMIQPSQGGPPQEISRLLKRLSTVTGIREKRYRYYVPKDVRDDARFLAESRNW
jgi:HD superfamily phosphohydrolase